MASPASCLSKECTAPLLPGDTACAFHRALFDRVARELRGKKKITIKKPLPAPVVVTHVPATDGPEKLARAVHAAGQATLAKLAADLGTSKRTAYRHASAAKAAGWITARRGAHGGYEAGQTAPPAAASNSLAA